MYGELESDPKPENPATPMAGRPQASGGTDVGSGMPTAFVASSTLPSSVPAAL